MENFEKKRYFTIKSLIYSNIFDYLIFLNIHVRMLIFYLHLIFTF